MIVTNAFCSWFCAHKFVDDRVSDIKIHQQKQTESETQLEIVYLSLKMKMVAV